MNPQTSPTHRRVVRKIIKQAPTTADTGQTVESPPAPLKASQIGDNLEARIRVRAYELYVQRGAHEGHELDDWLQAEKELWTSQS